MACGTERLNQVFADAGLERKGYSRSEFLLPGEAWRLFRESGLVPDVVIRDDGPADEINAEWLRLASEHGVVTPDGEFLINVAVDRGCPCTRDWWFRVRLSDGWNLAGLLGSASERTDFLTRSVNGDMLVAVTSGEHGISVCVMTDLRRRFDEAAQEQGRETPEERDRAWASLLGGPPADRRLLLKWADGLARNPSAPDDVLEGLLGHTKSLRYRKLPRSVVEAALTHPDWEVRAGLIEHSHYTADQWTQLVLNEREPKRLWELALVAADFRVELGAEAIEVLASHPSAQVRAEAAYLPGLPPHLARALAFDTDPEVRAVACSRAWEHLEASEKRTLLDDPDRKVRAAALREHHQDHPLSRDVLESGDIDRRAALEWCRLERDLAEQVAHHGELAERLPLAANPHLDADVIDLLAADAEASVRRKVFERPDLSDAQRDSIDIGFTSGEATHRLEWVAAHHDDPEAMRRLAASPHALVRRSVARAKRLPLDVVERLAQDEDKVVQLFLAESCDDAPAEMLLRVCEWWSGSLSHPDRPRSHPNFPRTGLLRYADDPNPRMRRLALDDPESSAELVERFSRDDSDQVRARAAGDPRLSPASAVRLLQDGNVGVRWRAAQNPRLPARVLVGRLLEIATAEGAAAYPDLPVELMRRMLRWIQDDAQE